MVGVLVVDVVSSGDSTSSPGVKQEVFNETLVPCFVSALSEK
jgi:hypothetical protein